MKRTSWLLDEGRDYVTPSRPSPGRRPSQYRIRKDRLVEALYLERALFHR
jgi:hypothetical protein